jgi:hypothetical protein
LQRVAKRAYDVAAAMLREGGPRQHAPEARTPPDQLAALTSSDNAQPGGARW